MRFRVVIIFIMLSMSLSAQDTPQVYDPGADAQAELAMAVKKASAEQKHVLLIIGGNWCPWCVRLNSYLFDDPQLDSLVQANYNVVKVNYSKENKNLEIMRRLAVPERFGFPVLVILNEKGQRIHTQNSAYLEKDKSYDRKVVWNFLLGWNYKAVRPENHKDFQ